MDMFEIGIIKLYENVNEEKMWNLYLHSFPSKSFEDWKDEHIKKVNRELNETEITTMLKESNDILTNFHI